MLKVNSYSAKGVKGANVSLPKEWDIKANPALLAQALRVYIDRNHVGLRKTQTRAEVSRTTKKLYKQKGTGGARHGSRKAPVFVGGGVALGPRPVKRELTLPKALKQKALALAVSEKAKEGKIITADLSFKKVAEASKFLEKVLNKKFKKVTFVLNKNNLKVSKSINNLQSSRVVIFENLNAFDIFFGGNIIFDTKLFKKEKKETKK